MIDFSKRILLLGYGAVAQCALPILLKHLRIPPRNITVMDFEDRTEALAPWTGQGRRFAARRKIPGRKGE